MFGEHFGVEARIDAVGFDIATMGPVLTAETSLGNASLDLGAGVVEVGRLFPLSLNVKARSGGRVRVFASGGLSYLPRVDFDAAQPVSLDLSVAGFPAFELASVTLGAGASTNPDGRRLGVNAGAGIEAGISSKVSFVSEVRVHAFDRQRFTWQRASAPVTELTALLLEELERLPAVEIDMIYFQVVAGVSFRLW